MEKVGRHCCPSLDSWRLSVMMCTYLEWMGEECIVQDEVNWVNVMIMCKISFVYVRRSKYVE